MKKILLLIAVIACGVAAEYVQTSPTGAAPWTPKRRVDSARVATIADSAKHAPPSAFADSSRVSGLADSAKHTPPSAFADSSRRSGLADSAKRAGWAPRADSARAAGISDTAKKAGTAANSLALGGIPAAGYGTLAQDTAISKRVASDTATVLRTGIASAITTSEAYATARISDSLTANARAWTTLTAAKSSIHDTATALRTYIGSASTTGNAATATKLSAARTIATSGDVTGTPTAFDGTANITIPTTLPTLLPAGSAGGAASVPTLTWDAKGRLTAAGSAAISIPHTQISDWAATLANYDLLSNTTYSIPVTGDGIITLAAGSRIEGTYDIRWEASSRVEHLQIVVSTTQFSTNYLAINAYKTYGSANSFQRVSIYQNSDGSGKYLCLTIGNRNSRTNAISVKYFGAYGSAAGGTYTGSEVAYLIPTLNQYQNTGSLNVPIIYENGTSLSSKYLQANQSISLTGAVTGSGTTSIATSFANTHLAGINQDLTTTSSPTFASATIGNGIYRAYAGADPSLGSIYASGVAPGALNYVLAWEPNGNTSYLSGIVASYLCVNGVPVITATSSGASVTGTLTASGLITANGGISGNLAGHASLDIPLTGSAAITGVLASSNRANFGTLESPWGDVHTINLYAAGEVVAQGQLTALAIGSTLGMSSGGSLTVAGNTTLNGGLDLAKNLQSSIYTITPADQGKMVVSNNTLNLPSFSAGTNVGFWCLVNWHVGGGNAKFGPTTSGTPWILRGQYLDVSTSMPFTGVVSWDGYNWYAN